MANSDWSTRPLLLLLWFSSLTWKTTSPLLGCELVHILCRAEERTRNMKKYKALGILSAVNIQTQKKRRKRWCSEQKPQLQICIHTDLLIYVLPRWSKTESVVRLISIGKRRRIEGVKQKHESKEEISTWEANNTAGICWCQGQKRPMWKSNLLHSIGCRLSRDKSKGGKGKWGRKQRCG